MFFRTAVACAVTGVLLLAGCASTDSASESGQPTVVTGFYPLQFAVEQIGGDHVHVTGLTQPGAEPHDLELAPRDVGTLLEADLVVYLDGFQPALDDTIQQQRAEVPRLLEVSRYADLQPLGSHAPDEGHGDELGHGPGDEDPHFWLDPHRYADVAAAIGDRLGKIDPAHAETFTANAERFQAKLNGLDKDFRSGLDSCTSRELVTSHAAFGYLASRYDFHQHGITGLSPEQEPSPGKVGELARFVREHDVGTIYYETLVSDRIARTIAQETGADVAVLDPIEGLTDASKGSDYFEVMRANLATLQKGQGCT